MKEKKFGFEKYLLKLGGLVEDYPYTIDQIIENIAYFKFCYEKDLSAYKAIEWLGLYISGEIGPIEDIKNIKKD
jgi:hypothetical protein